MSFEIQGRVLSLSQTKQSQRMLLLVLAYHADRFGVCWPSIDTLAKEINTNPRNAGALVTKLKETKEIIVFEGGGRNNSNTYIITLGQTKDKINEIMVTHPRLKRIINPVDSGKNPVDSGKNPVDSGKNPVDIDRGTKRNLKGTEREQQHVAADDEPEFLDLNPELTESILLYKNNIGPMNGIISRDFSDLFSGLSPPPGETKEDWIRYAVLTASSNGKNRWSYVKAIINGINESGSLQAHKELWKDGNKLGGVKASERGANGPAGGERNETEYSKKYSRVNDDNIEEFVKSRTIK